MPTYSEDIASEWVRRLSSITHGKLREFDYEFQDGFNALLITATLAVDPDVSTLHDLRMLIEAELGNELSGDHETPSWVVNIYYHHELIESIMENIRS